MFQWVIYSYLFIVMAFTSILWVIFNSTFWLDLNLFFYVNKLKFNIMYAVSFIYSNSSPHFFPFSSFQGKFFLSPRKREFFTVTTVDDCPFHGIYRFPHCPWVWPLVRIAVTIGNWIPSLRIFTIWRLAGWQRYTRRPPQMRIQNGPPFIIYCSSSGGSLWGGVFHKCSDIYTPPPLTDWSMLNRYFSSQETPQHWCARAFTSDPRWGGVGGVVSWTRTLQHGDSNTPRKMTEYITCGTSSTRAAPKNCAAFIPKGDKK